MKKSIGIIAKRILIAILAAAMIVISVAALVGCDDRSAIKKDFVSLHTLRGGYIYLHIQDNLGSLALPSRPRHMVGFARDEDSVDALIATLEKVKDGGIIFKKLDDNRISVLCEGDSAKSALIVRYNKDKEGRHYTIYDLSAYIKGSEYFVAVPFEYLKALPEPNAIFGYFELSPDKSYALTDDATEEKFKAFYEGYGYEVDADGNVLMIQDLKVEDIPESYFTQCEKTKPSSISFMITFTEDGVVYEARGGYAE